MGYNKISKMKYKFSSGKGKRSWLRLSAVFMVLVLVLSLTATLSSPAKVRAAIALVGTPNTSTTATGATATSIVVTTPSGVASGNVLIVQLTYDPGTNKGVTVTKPSGWLQAGTNVLNGNWWQSVYYKVAGASEPANYTFTLSRAANIGTGIIAFSGVDNTAPIDDIQNYSSGGTNSTTHSAPSASASTNGDYMVDLWGYKTNVTASGYDASLTANYTASTTNIGVASAGKSLNNAGATGTFNSTTATNSTWLANTVLLLPSQRPAGISLVSSTTANCGAGCTSLGVTSPAGWQAGDFFIANVFWNTAATLTIPDATWIQIGTTQTNGTTYKMATYYHVADVSDPASYTWQFSTSSHAIIGVADYTGVDTAAPVDDTQVAVDTSNATHTAPSVTSTHSNDYYVGLWGYEGDFKAGINAGQFTSTLNSVYNVEDGALIGSVHMYDTLGNAGASGTRFTTSVNPPNSTQTRNTIAIMRAIALKPFIPVPKLYAPANGAVGQILRPVMQLNDYLIVAGPEKYKIELCSNSTCTTILNTYDQTASQTGWSGQDVLTGTAYNGTTAYSTSTVASFTIPSALSTATTYYWRAYAYDVNGGYFTPPSNIFSFTTSGPPSPPTLFAPTAGATGVTVTPEFQLAATDPDTDNLQYKLQICANASCTSVLYTYDQTASQTGWSGQDGDNFTTYGSDSASASNSTLAYFTIPVALNFNTTYYWQAFATDPGGTALWSSSSGIRSFTTNSGQTVIVNGSIVQGKIL